MIYLFKFISSRFGSRYLYRDFIILIFQLFDTICIQCIYNYNYKNTLNTCAGMRRVIPIRALRTFWKLFMIFFHPIVLSSRTTVYKEYTYVFITGYSYSIKSLFVICASYIDFRARALYTLNGKINTSFLGVPFHICILCSVFDVEKHRSFDKHCSIRIIIVLISIFFFLSAAFVIVPPNKSE